MTTKTGNETKPGRWRKIIRHEMFEFFLNFLFLAFFLISFTWYRHLILASYHIRDLGYWGPLIEAAILAKIIMIGDIMHVGRRFRNQSLALTAVYLTLAFSLLVVAFSVLEHVIGAMIHGERPAAGLSEIESKGWQQLLAWYVLIIVAFLPFFIVKQIEAAIGPEKFRRMFFHRNTQPGDADTGPDL